jgi:hypothetical protein
MNKQAGSLAIVRLLVTWATDCPKRDSSGLNAKLAGNSKLSRLSYTKQGRGWYDYRNQPEDSLVMTLGRASARQRASFRSFDWPVPFSMP